MPKRGYNKNNFFVSRQTREEMNSIPQSLPAVTKEAAIFTLITAYVSQTLAKCD